MRNRVLLIFCLSPVVVIGCNGDTDKLKTEKVSYKVAVVMPLSSGNDWSRTIDWALENFRQAQADFQKLPT